MGAGQSLSVCRSSRLHAAVSMVVLGAALLPARLAAAHDYWLVPQPLVITGDQEVAVSLFVGEDFVAEDEKHFEAARATRFSLVHGSESTDLLPRAAEGGSPIARVAVSGAGGHLFVLDRNIAKIELEAGKFETYLKHEGLDSISAERAQRGESGKPGRERYTRYLKALVQVGEARDATFGRIVGQTLEMVPESDPGLAAPGESLNVRIRFRGAPLAGARIEAFSRQGADVKDASYRSDENGIVRVAIDRRGAWLLRMVHMVRCEGCTDADWESAWSSYVFASRPVEGGTVLAPPMLSAKVDKAPSVLMTSGKVAVACGFVLFAAVAVILRMRRRRRRPEGAGG